MYFPLLNVECFPCFGKVVAVSRPAILDLGTQCRTGAVQLIFPFYVHEPGGHLSAARAWYSMAGASVATRVGRVVPGWYRSGQAVQGVGYQGRVPVLGLACLATGLSSLA